MGKKPPSVPLRVPAAGPYERPDGVLRPGDLVIISGKIPSGDEQASATKGGQQSKMPDYRATLKSYMDANALATAVKKGYTVYPKQVNSIEELEFAINWALQRTARRLSGSSLSATREAINTARGQV